MLKVVALEAGYGQKQVLFAVDLQVAAHEIVALIGPNGAGKSTLLRVICGLLPVWKGELLFGGHPIDGATPQQNVARGISLVPQGGRVFTELTVQENLEIGAARLPGRRVAARIDSVLELFPALVDRRRTVGGRLSGGERQMLALARGLMLEPKLLLLDEPSLGLSPAFVSAIFERIAAISCDAGTSALVVEHKVREVLAISQRVCGLKLGRVACAGPSDSFRDDTGALRKLFL